MPDAGAISHSDLYDAFAMAAERALGPKDNAVIHAIVGFEFGGPPDLLVFRNPPGVKGIFYVTSDLLFIIRQPKNSLGRYELAICLPTEGDWARKILFKLSHATVEEVFEAGYTADITAWVAPDCPLKGLLFRGLVSFDFEGQSFGILLCIGVTRAELDFTVGHGSDELLRRLESAGVFPVTDTQRPSIALDA